MEGRKVSERKKNDLIRAKIKYHMISVVHRIWTTLYQHKYMQYEHKKENIWRRKRTWKKRVWKAGSMAASKGWEVYV